MTFEVTASTVDGEAVLRVRGDLDVVTAPILAQAVGGQLSASPGVLTIDLTDATYLDSAGARQLARSARQAADSGTALQLLCPPGNKPVRLVLNLMELQAIIPILDSPA